MKSLWVPISAAVAQQRNVETIANNVANATTPGFKRDQLVFKEHLTALSKQGEVVDLPRKEWAPEDFYRSMGAEHGFVKVDGSYFDKQQGPLNPTRNPLDLALQGDGMFEVLTPNGIRYTRKGVFTISNDGFLVTDQGYRVLGLLDTNQLLPNIKSVNDNPTTQPNEEVQKIPQPQDRLIRVPPTGRVSINLQGEIFIGNQRINQLSVVEFKDLHALRKEGNSFFINYDNSNIKREIATKIHQGFIEGSNVNAISEMSALIKAHRNFESIQKAIKAYDQISAKSVNELTRY